MIRELYAFDGSVNYEQLLAELRIVEPFVRGCNEVSGQVAVYTDGPQDVAVVADVVGAHVPLPDPVDPLFQLAQAIVDATDLNDIKPVAQAILGG
jgi:hypothetical protein